MGSLDGTQSKLSSTGRLLWQRALGHAIYASGAVTEAGVLVGTDGDELWLLDLSTGASRLRLPLGPCLGGEGMGGDRVRCDADGSAAVTADGRIYQGADALYLFGFDGRLRWRRPLDGHAQSSVAVGPDGTAYVGTQGGGVLAVAPDGRLRWQFKLPHHCDATPAVPGTEVVYAGCDDGRLYALDAVRGRLRWELPTGGRVHSSPAVGQDGTIYVGSYSGRLYAVAPDGKPRWTFATGGPLHASPVVDAAGTVLVGSRDGRLYAVGPAGRQLWRYPLPDQIDSTAVVAPKGLVYVGCDDGYLYALGPASSPRARPGSAARRK